MKNRYTVPECVICVIDAGDVMLIKSREIDVSDIDVEINVGEHFDFS